MRFRTYSHRHGLTLFKHEEPFTTLWKEIEDVIAGVSEDEICREFNLRADGSKSISRVVNDLLKSGFERRGWTSESPIFADDDYVRGDKGRFRLDFAKEPVSVEVAFNHGEAAAWNLLKPVLASELNHVPKAIQTQAAVIITATEALKAAGGFDSAVGTFEKYAKYLKPMNAVLTVPLVLIGLEAPETFRIVHISEGSKKRGVIEWVSL